MRGTAPSLPDALTPRREVKVNVVDDLASLRAAVHADSIASLREARKLSKPTRHQKAATNQLRVGRLEIR